MNKTIFTIFLGVILFSITSWAAVPSVNHSWDVIRGNSSIVITNDFQAFGPDGVFNVCAAGEYLHSIKPVEVGNGYREISMPKTRIADMCAEYSGGVGEEPLICARYERRPVTIASQQKLGVWLVRHDTTEFLFSKGYAIPACE